MRPTTIVVIGCLALASTAKGQAGQSEVVGYVSLTHTPIGLLAPIAPRPQVGLTQNGASFALRYGRLSDGPRDNKKEGYAGSVFFPVGGSATVSLTGGGYKETCPDPECRGILMIGGGAQTTILPDLLAGSLARLSVDISGDLGWSARQFNTSYFTGHVGAPVTLANGAPPTAGMRVAAWVTPGFGFGQASVSDNSPLNGSRTGSRWTLGGGAALYNPQSTVSLQAGFMDVFASDSRTAFGVNLVLQW